MGFSTLGCKCPLELLLRNVVWRHQARPTFLETFPTSKERKQFWLANTPGIWRVVFIFKGIKSGDADTTSTCTLWHPF